MQVQPPNANLLKTNAGQCSRHGKVTLEAFLPEAMGQGAAARLAAPGGAGQHLGRRPRARRDGAAMLDQDAAFGEVHVAPVASASEDVACSGAAAA